MQTELKLKLAISGRKSSCDLDSHIKIEFEPDVLNFSYDEIATKAYSHRGLHCIRIRHISSKK